MASKFFTNINYYKSVSSEIIKEKVEALENTVKVLYNKDISIEEIANITKLDINKIEKIINNN